MELSINTDPYPSKFPSILISPLFQSSSMFIQRRIVLLPLEIIVLIQLEYEFRFKEKRVGSKSGDNFQKLIDPVKISLIFKDQYLC